MNLDFLFIDVLMANNVAPAQGRTREAGGL